MSLLDPFLRHSFFRKNVAEVANLWQFCFLLDPPRYLNLRSQASETNGALTLDQLAVCLGSSIPSNQACREPEKADALLG